MNEWVLITVCGTISSMLVEQLGPVARCTRCVVLVTQCSVPHCTNHCTGGATQNTGLVILLTAVSTITALRRSFGKAAQLAESFPVFYNTQAIAVFTGAHHMFRAS